MKKRSLTFIVFLLTAVCLSLFLLKEYLYRNNSQKNRSELHMKEKKHIEDTKMDAPKSEACGEFKTTPLITDEKDPEKGKPSEVKIEKADGNITKKRAWELAVAELDKRKLKYNKNNYIVTLEKNVYCITFLHEEPVPPSNPTPRTTSASTDDSSSTPAPFVIEGVLCRGDFLYRVRINSKTGELHQHRSIEIGR